MRKSFTRLSSLLVLLLLSFQMVMAIPKLATTGGLSPTDGGKVNPTNNPVLFTMNFQADVTPGLLEIIGLYNRNGVEAKAIQLRVDQRTTSVDGATVFTHPDGIVTFKGKVVTIQFRNVDWNSLQNDSLWITVGASAIKDGTGNLDITTAFDGGKRLDKWDFTVMDLGAPTVKALYPKDDAKDVPTGYSPFAIKFKETVQFVDQNTSTSSPGIQYTQVLGDFALYLDIDGTEPTPEEGGDLAKLLRPTLRFYLAGSNVPSSSSFDSITITWVDPTLPNDTKLYMRVKPGMIEDLAGNDFAGINNETTWNFNTRDDAFTAPVIAMVPNSDCNGSTTIRTDNNFTIDFDEKLFYNGINSAGNASFLQVLDQDDLKRFITITDKSGNIIAIKTAKITTSDLSYTIIVDPNVDLTSAGVEFTVAIAADAFLDASGNKSKAASKKFAAGNWDAPKVVTQRVSNQSGTTMDFYISTNEPCAVHYIVVRKDPAYDPGKDDIFGHNSNTATPTPFYFYKNTTTGNADLYYDVTSYSSSADINDVAPTIPASFCKDEGNIKKYFGRQTASDKFTLVEKFAEGNIIILQDSVETLKRISNLPPTHGVITAPTKAYYEIWYELIDTLCTQGKYDGSYWKSSKERISAPQVMDGTTVYTTDVLPPDAWFDADSAKVVGDNLPNRNKLAPPSVSGLILGQLAKQGKIYINFNEPIRKENNSEFSTDPATQNTELKACLFVHEGSLGNIDLNSDAPWASLTSYGYHASLANGNTQIVITPDSSWNSSDTIYVKIKNSKIEDLRGNEIVPLGGLYTERFKVESYIPPLVRYTFGTIYDELDGNIDVPYKINLNTTVASITVTVSNKIFAYTGCWLENELTSDPADRYQVAAEEMVALSNDTTRLNYVGKFFKVRKGTATSVDENSGNPLETSDFSFSVDYTYGDSTKIIITPKKQYDSEVWYFIQLDGRVKDINQRTINQGADVDDNASRPIVFQLLDAPTGNATVPGWTKGDPAEDDNKTCVFKSEDSRNPVLTFYTKKQSTLLSNLVNINTKTNISLSDTIGVYIDEYVSLGFDHYVHFDAITGQYTLDANAMRRYFTVYDYDSVAMNFDVVGLDISALMSDSLIFYIDPYYVNTDGTYKSGSEGSNFKSAKKYWVHFNSQDADDHGMETKYWGKEKGIYWDDNQNLVLDKWAWFSTELSPDPACISAVITPAPSASCLIASSISHITVGLPFAPVNNNDIPYIEVTEGTSSVYTLQGYVKPGNSLIVQYPVRFDDVDDITVPDDYQPNGLPTGLRSDSTYRIRIGNSIDGQIVINSGNPQSDEWPLNTCDLLPLHTDSTWTYKMVDETAPALDTLQLTSHANYGSGSSQYRSYLYPQDDTCGFDKTKNIIMIFNEEVELVTNKTLRIYDSSDNTKAIIYAQQCSYGKQASPNQAKDDYNVIIVPASAFSTNLEYNTNYHISVDAGFVRDRSVCHYNNYLGIFVADGTASCAGQDGVNDWSFRTGSDPAPYFTAFSPKDASATVSTLTVTFSEEVFANVGNILIDTIGPGNVFGNVATFAVTSTNMIRKVSGTNAWEIHGFAPVFGKQYFVTIPNTAFKDGLNQLLTASCTQGTIVYDNILPITGQTSTSAAQWYINFRDAIAPYVLNYWPRDGKKQIPYNAYIYIEFNESISLMDGTAIVPNPFLLQNIGKFITVNSLTAGQYVVEFVGNNKRLLRITPMDPAGYNYDPASLPNPTMQAYTDYTVTLVNTATIGSTTYTLVDGGGNVAVNKSFKFRTEDVVAPIISNPVVTLPLCGKNEFNIHYDAIEAHNLGSNPNLSADRDTVVLYWAVLPSSVTTVPTAAQLFAQSVPGALKSGIKGGKNTAGGGINIKVDMGEWPESPQFKLYAVSRDNEQDIWLDKPTGNTAVFDSLFMIRDYAEGIDHVRDIKLAPNTNNIVVASPVFRVWDNDAPQLADSYPHNGDLQIPINAVPKFWFKEKVEAGSLSPNAITLRRWDNNIAVSATVAWPTGTGLHQDSIFTITPTQPLEQETKYYIEFDRYAIQDTQNVCPAGTPVFYPQMVNRVFSFVTLDNIGPRFEKATPVADATCVSCPGLNAAGTDSITLDFYDANQVIVAANAADPFVYLYRDAVSPTTAWLVVPASKLVIIKDLAVDTLYHVKVPITHQYYPNDLIRVEVPAGLITDKYNNKYSNPKSAYWGTTSAVDVIWKYRTCNTEAPVVNWTVHNLSAYFNYSELPKFPAAQEPGIFAKWDEGFRNGVQGEADPTGIPTNIALKLNFGEAVAFNTSTTSTAKWENLSDFQWGTSSTKLTPTELMSILKISGLTFKYDSPMSKATTSDIDTIVVSGNTVTLTFKYGTSGKLPISKILAQAKTNGQIENDGASTYLVDYYKASLNSLTAYDVTVTAEKVRAVNNCVSNSAARYVQPDIVTLNTRDDTPPTVDFKNGAGKSICGDKVCIGKNEPITISFSDSVVKTSLDVNWLALESNTFDNLPLRKEDIQYPVKNTSPYHYFELIKLQSKSDGSFYRRDVVGHKGDTVTINNVTIDPAMMNYTVSSNQDLVSEGWYELVFRKYTVKKYINSDPSGTIFEGSSDTCRFKVGDYIAPLAISMSPDSGEVGVDSDTKQIKVAFNDNVLLGSTIEPMRIRRQDGSIFKEFTKAQTQLVNARKTDQCDTIVFNVGALENFTTYYIEMPAGFVTGDSVYCSPIPFAGFGARLSSNGVMMSADWWFSTSDSTAPELMAVTGSETQRSPDALFPKVGSTVATNSDLVMVFDENIEIENNIFRGIVIYHDNGDTATHSFGNAVEYIPWSNFYTPFDNRIISISGSNPYDGLTSNVITINPATVFDKKGVYYVRVSGMDIEDGNGNTWDSSINPQRDEIKDREWYFSIVNDATPVLVATNPTYDGVNAARVYTDIPVTAAPTLGFVKTDLSMTFKDGEGDPIDVAPGSSTRMVRIFEYTYDAATAQFKSKPWIALPITHPSIKFVGNVVTIENVILRDGIDGRGTNLANDSVYYVTVDPGAVVNALDAATAWWPGINNPFVWRFQTRNDVTFVDANPTIISPLNKAENLDLRIPAASNLVVDFGEGIEALKNPTPTSPKVQIFNADADTLVEAIPVTKAMISGVRLTVPTTKLKDVTKYYVVIQAGAFGDTATVSNPNLAFGGENVWAFTTGDNTNPQLPVVSPLAGCADSKPTLTMTFTNEPFGVTNVGGAGALEISDASGKVWATVDASAVTISVDKKTVSAVIVDALPDTTLLTVTVPAAFIHDLGNNALPNLPITWTFTTGENTAPTVVSITPDAVVTPDDVLTITFSEIVGAVGGKTITIGSTAVDVDSLETTDGIVFTYPLKGLSSETTYEVVIEAGAFIDINSGCTPNVVAKTTESFVVGDITAPVATGSPKTAADYVGLKLNINFTDAVTPATGNVVIYDAETDVAIETIAVNAAGKFTASAGNTVYTFASEKVKFGQYYILIDAGAFVDNTAAPIAKACPGISSKTEWPLSIIDPSFSCGTPTLIRPARTPANVPTTTTVEISFCDERLAPGVGAITIGDQSNDRVEGVNYFVYPVNTSAVIIQGSKLTIPVTGLKENTTYSIIIPYGAITDEAGNPFIGITDANWWIFTTGDFTLPVVSVNAVTVMNDGTGAPVAITSSEAGKVYLAKNDVAATEAAMIDAIAQKKAVAAVLTAPGSVSVSVEGLEAGTYKAYGFDAAGKMGTAVNVVTVTKPIEIPSYTIKQIQGEAAASPLAGTKVRTKGTVTLVISGTGFYMQDANAAWGGIFVNSTEAMSIGSSVEIIGTVSEVLGITVIGAVENISYIPQVISTQPVTVTSAAAITEQYESVLVHVEGRPTTGGTVNADWTIGSFSINNSYLGDYPVKQQYKYGVNGIVVQSGTSYKVLATQIVDLSTLNPVTELSNSVKVYPNPFDKYITLEVSNDVVITKAVITNIAGQLVKEVINPNNTIPTSELRSGVYFISLHTADGKIAKAERIIKR